MSKKLGQVPVLSKFFVRLRISSARKSVTKLGEKIENQVLEQRNKIQAVIDAAERTDSANLIRQANELKDKLEDAACVDVEFEKGEAADIVDTKAKKDIHKKCVEAVTTKTRGSPKKKPGPGGWTPDESRLFRECEDKGGPNGWQP